MSILTQKSRVLTARINVAANTPAASPVSKIITSPLPILQDVKLFIFSNAGAVNSFESGWRLSSGGMSIIPCTGSLDDLVTGTFAPMHTAFVFDSGVMNYQLSGPPYEINFEAYDTDAAYIYYFLTMRVTDSILPPEAPIQNDSRDS